MQIFCAFKKMLNCVPVIKVSAVYWLVQITGWLPDLLGREGILTKIFNGNTTQDCRSPQSLEMLWLEFPPHPHPAVCKVPWVGFLGPGPGGWEWTAVAGFLLALDSRAARGALRPSPRSLAFLEHALSHRVHQARARVQWQQHRTHRENS